MNVYRIKIDKTQIYIKGVLFDTSENNVKLEVIPTFVKEDAGWYEKDKAEKYCEELNKQHDDVLFVLEEVIR